MRKIGLDTYEYEGQPFDVKQSMANILFLPQLKLGTRQLIEHDRIARKIEEGTDSVLLEESEYLELRQAVESFDGYGRQDLEFVQRVINAPQVSVGET